MYNIKESIFHLSCLIKHLRELLMNLVTKFVLFFIISLSSRFQLFFIFVVLGENSFVLLRTLKNYGNVRRLLEYLRLSDFYRLLYRLPFILKQHRILWTI